MTKEFLMDIACLNFLCPKCGETVVYELKTMHDFGQCRHCGNKFTLDQSTIEARNVLIAMIEQDATD